MRLAVLSSPASWYARDLQRAAGMSDSVQAMPFSRIRSSVEHSTAVFVEQHCLHDYDVVLVRTMPPGSLEQVVFRMDALQRLEKNGQTIVNSPKAVETAVDKFLTLAKLRACGLDVPRTDTSQTVDGAMEGFHQLGGDVVLKPLFGSEGRGITRINDEAIAERTYRLLVQLGAVVYQQEFVQHEGYDLRLMVIGQDVYGMRRTNPRDWRTNISRGAVSEPLQVTDDLVELALRATRAVHAVVAGVDLLPARDGRMLAVEVNAVPGWRALARTLDVDMAKSVLDFLRRMS